MSGEKPVYCPQNFVIIEGIMYKFLYSMKLKSGLNKEYYRCEFCTARLHVFKDTMRCKLMSAHSDVQCTKQRKEWEAQWKLALKEGNTQRLESILEETLMGDKGNTDNTVIESEEDEDNAELMETDDTMDISNATILADASELSQLFRNAHLEDSTFNNTTEAEESTIIETKETDQVSDIIPVFNQTASLSPIKRPSLEGGGFFMPTPAPKKAMKTLNGSTAASGRQATTKNVKNSTVITNGDDNKHGASSTNRPYNTRSKACDSTSHTSQGASKNQVPASSKVHGKDSNKNNNDKANVRKKSVGYFDETLSPTKKTKKFHQYLQSQGQKLFPE